MAKRLAGKVVVVTGASRGVGRGISATFAAEGAAVAMLARGGSELEEAAASLTGALPVLCDIADPASVRAAFSTIEARLGGIDVLVNNAALANPRLIEEADDDLAQREVAANILGPIYCIREAVRSMRLRGGGDIINVSSESIRNPYPYLGLYAATKSALETLSVGLRNELKGSNIRVTVYRSGRVRGTFSRDWEPDMAARARAAAREAGYYAFAGEAISPDVPGRAMVDLVLLPREAHVDLIELRAT
jgi:meso-butanediol dehydrogenase / (S,S)-butanediol dehydrogenase / diacetyl reductase